jgi:hypothetical protein
MDVRLSRYESRSFHALAGESSEQKRYGFRQARSLRFACILATESSHAP